MELSCLIKITKGSMESYELETKTPSEVKEDHDLDTRWYLELYDETTGERSDIDLSLIFLETKLVKCSTWDEFANMLTDMIIRAYTTSVPDKDSKNLTVTHLLNSDDFEISYCNINTPEDRNIPVFKWRMPDIVITRINQKNTNNFKNCICSINGIVSRPYVFKGELYIKDGNKHMLSTTEQFTPSVAMLDFSELGDIEIIPLSECTGTVLTKSTYNSATYADIKVYIPEQYTLENKTVFPVIAHSLYMPEEITISGNNSLVISPYRLPIRTSLIKLFQHNDEVIPNTDVVNTQTSVEHYIRNSIVKTDINTGKELDEYGNFLVVVNNPSIFIEKTKVHNYSDSVFSTTVDDGILFDQSTHSIYDYVKIDYDSVTDLYTTRCNPNYELDIPFSENTYSILSWDCAHKEELFNIHRKNLYFLKIFGL